MFGLKRGILGFSEYDERWPKIFEDEQVRLFNVLKDDVFAIEHFGSTSVKGLFAKPIIDIAITFEDKDKLQSIIDKLVSCGYAYKGLHASNVHWYFVLYEENVALFHVHVWNIPSEHYNMHIVFRDKLRMYDELRDEYASLKLEWAEAAEWDRVKYTDSKSEFIDKVMNY